MTGGVALGVTAGVALGVTGEPEHLRQMHHSVNAVIPAAASVSWPPQQTPGTPSGAWSASSMNREKQPAQLNRSFRPRKSAVTPAPAATGDPQVAHAASGWSSESITASSISCMDGDPTSSGAKPALLRHTVAQLTEQVMRLW